MFHMFIICYLIRFSNAVFVMLMTLMAHDLKYCTISSIFSHLIFMLNHLQPTMTNYFEVKYNTRERLMMIKSWILCLLFAVTVSPQKESCRHVTYNVQNLSQVI